MTPVRNKILGPENPPTASASQPNLSIQPTQKTMSSTSPFSETDQKELEAFLESENAKARIQQTVHLLTDRCWDKCISKVGNKLDQGQESCLSNCVDRFLDSSVFIVKRLEQLRSGGGMM